jgi:cytidyltransferase-like protein
LSVNWFYFTPIAAKFLPKDGVKGKYRELPRAPTGLDTTLYFIYLGEDAPPPSWNRLKKIKSRIGEELYSHCWRRYKRSMSMNIALYGGSFNPPHNGHIDVARGALGKLRIDKLIWMPAGDPPHKTLPGNSPDAAHRLALSRLAAEELPGAEVSDYEMTSGKRYTVDTAEMLHEKYKPDMLWLIMGQDMWDTFNSWRRVEELKRIAAVYVFPRTEVSSTEVRALLARGLGKDKIPAKVWEYIRKEGLYGSAKP